MDEVLLQSPLVYMYTCVHMGRPMGSQCTTWYRWDGGMRSSLVYRGTSYGIPVYHMVQMDRWDIALWCTHGASHGIPMYHMVHTCMSIDFIQ